MPRQNCNSMAVFAVTVYSVFTIFIEEQEPVISQALAYLYLFTNLDFVLN